MKQVDGEAIISFRVQEQCYLAVVHDDQGDHLTTKTLGFFGRILRRLGIAHQNTTLANIAAYIISHADEYKTLDIEVFERTYRLLQKSERKYPLRFAESVSQFFDGVQIRNWNNGYFIPNKEWIDAKSTTSFTPEFNKSQIRALPTEKVEQFLSSFSPSHIEALSEMQLTPAILKMGARSDYLNYLTAEQVQFIFSVPDSEVAQMGIKLLPHFSIDTLCRLNLSKLSKEQIIAISELALRKYGSVKYKWIQKVDAERSELINDSITPFLNLWDFEELPQPIFEKIDVTIIDSKYLPKDLIKKFTATQLQSLSVEQVLRNRCWFSKSQLQLLSSSQLTFELLKGFYSLVEKLSDEQLRSISNEVLLKIYDRRFLYNFTEKQRLVLREQSVKRFHEFSETEAVQLIQERFTVDELKNLDLSLISNEKIVNEVCSKILKNSLLTTKNKEWIERIYRDNRSIFEAYVLKRISSVQLDVLSEEILHLADLNICNLAFFSIGTVKMLSREQIRNLDPKKFRQLKCLWANFGPAIRHFTTAQIVAWLGQIPFEILKTYAEIAQLEEVLKHHSHELSAAERMKLKAALNGTFYKDDEPFFRSTYDSQEDFQSNKANAVFPSIEVKLFVKDKTEVGQVVYGILLALKKHDRLTGKQLLNAVFKAIGPKLVELRKIDAAEVALVERIRKKVILMLHPDKNAMHSHKEQIDELLKWINSTYQ